MGDSEVENGAEGSEPESDLVKTLRSKIKSQEKELKEMTASLAEATEANHGFAVDKFIRDNRETYSYLEAEDLVGLSTQEEFKDRAASVQKRRAENWGDPVPAPAAQPEGSVATVTALHQVTQTAGQVEQMAATPPTVEGGMSSRMKIADDLAKEIGFTA